MGASTNATAASAKVPAQFHAMLLRSPCRLVNLTSIEERRGERRATAWTGGEHGPG